MYIDGLGISSYRSFGSDIQFIGPCNKINIFIGQNNSGKSNIIKYINDYLRDFTTIAAQSRNAPMFEGFDLHNEVKRTEKRKVAFGLKLNGEIYNKILKLKKIEDQTNPLRYLFDALLQFPEMTRDSDLAWFIYEANPGQPLKLSSELISEISHKRVNNNNPKDGLSFSDWTKLLSIAGSTNTIHDEKTLAAGLQYILHELNPTRIGMHAVTLIKAIREIKKDSSNSKYDYNGLNIIQELAKLERPDGGSEYSKAKDRFETINKFVCDVIGKSDVRLEIPDSKETILVKIDSKILPLENLGTGVHEIIILAIAATFLQTQIICIEEPEIHLHPLLQKKLLQYLDKHTTNQYFITTHSASMINVPGASIFHVRYDGKQSIVSPAISSNERFSICADLGCRASDILQSNCIIWVEGPSDRIYLNHWLATYAPELEEGVHFSIMFYGGRLLSHLSADDDEVSEFISLRRINQNISIIIDSDRERKGKLLNKTKIRIRDEFDHGPGFAWITAGREIENYVPFFVMEEAVMDLHPNVVSLAPSGQYDYCYHFTDKDGQTHNKLDKVKLAKQIIKRDVDWDVFDLRDKIQQVKEFIYKCNDIPNS